MYILLVLGCMEVYLGVGFCSYIYEEGGYLLLFEVVYGFIFFIFIRYFCCILDIEGES